jgi:hypothetical protein
MRIGEQKWKIMVKRELLEGNAVPSRDYNEVSIYLLAFLGSG